ncbi:MAG: hypothetical protein ACR2J3_04375 [Aridibacter sp.]
MEENKDFNLQKFQSEVLEDFKFLKDAFGYAGFYTDGFEDIEDKLDLSYSPMGLIKRVILSCFKFLGGKIKKNVLSKPDFIEKDKKAVEIMNNPEIRKLLCNALRKELKSDLFREEYQIKTVKAVTSTLAEDKAVKKFAIQRDVRLFSLVILKILQEGLQVYCRK